MGSTTGIEWADATWNPWMGCTPVSEGCEHCYMYRDAKRYGRDPSKIVRASDHTFRMPMSKKRMRPGSFVFVCSWSDFFHENVSDDSRHEAFGYMAYRYDVTFLILTKRPERMAAYLGEWEPEICGAMLANEFDRSPGKVVRHRLEQTVDWLHGEWCTDEYAMPPFDEMNDACTGLRNVWLGVTAENQARADERIPQLLSIDWPGKRFVSVEPMLGPVDLERTIPCGYYCDDTGPGHVDHGPNGQLGKIEWVICGAESGPHMRPFDMGWAADLRDQCQASGVPFMLKQSQLDGRIVKAPPLDGKQWLERPRPVKDGV